MLDHMADRDVLRGRKALKSAHQMERHLKGMANHYRIAALLLLEARGDMTLEDIVEALGGNEKTIGEHVRRLHTAGLVSKSHRGKYVLNALSPYGRAFAKFLHSFQQM